MTFPDCVLECSRNRDLIAQFDRLTGSNLSLKGAPIELMVDEATGKLADDVRQFTAFVYDVVWLTLIKDVNE